MVVYGCKPRTKSGLQVIHAHEFDMPPLKITLVPSDLLVILFSKFGRKSENNKIFVDILGMWNGFVWLRGPRDDRGKQRWWLHDGCFRDYVARRRISAIGRW